METAELDSIQLGTADPCTPSTPQLLVETKSADYAHAAAVHAVGHWSCIMQQPAAEPAAQPAAEPTAEPAEPAEPLRQCSQQQSEAAPHRSHHHHHHGRSRGCQSSSGTSVVAVAESVAESLTGRSSSFSSCYASSIASDATCSTSNSSVLSAAGCHVVCADRPKSFTAGDLQAHKHRLAVASTAARSSSPTASARHGACSHSHSGCCSAGGPAVRGCGKAMHRAAARPAACSSSGVVARSGGSSSHGTCGQHKSHMTNHSFTGSGDWRMLCQGGREGGMVPQRRVLLAESVSVQEIAKGFKPQWYRGKACKILQLFDGSKGLAADAAQLLKHVPQAPGLHLWLVKPPCSRQWVPVRLDAADNLHQRLRELLHPDGSCGPPGSKQRVLLDLQCRGFSLQVRYRLSKPSAGSVQQDLLSKLQRFDFALNDSDNGGCRPIELPDGRPTNSYPWVAGAPMKVLYEQLFAQPKLL